MESLGPRRARIGPLCLAPYYTVGSGSQLSRRSESFMTIGCDQLFIAMWRFAIPGLVAPILFQVLVVTMTWQMTDQYSSTPLENIGALAYIWCDFCSTPVLPQNLV